MSIEQYIETEFRRYFPDAQSLNVDFFDETIVAHVDGREYRFVCGSDDDFYRFDRVDGLSICDYITIPLMPE